jgi:hypothetical protein
MRKGANTFDSSTRLKFNTKKKEPPFGDSFFIWWSQDSASPRDQTAFDSSTRLKFNTKKRNHLTAIPFLFGGARTRRPRGIKPPSTVRPASNSIQKKGTTLRRFLFIWWSQAGSNRRPPACKAGALPAELWPQKLSGERQLNCQSGWHFDFQ